MKRILVCLCLLTPLGVSADELPTRKSGLWEIQMSMAGEAVGQTMKQCVDTAADAAMIRMGTDMSTKMGVKCTKNEFVKQGQRYIFDTDCMMGDIRLTSMTVFSGDFTSQYTGDSVTKFEPALLGISEQNMTITARWVGACEAGQKPGDIIMPGGIKMNINTMGKPQ